MLSFRSRIFLLFAVSLGLTFLSGLPLLFRLYSLNSPGDRNEAMAASLERSLEILREEAEASLTNQDAGERLERLGAEVEILYRSFRREGILGDDILVRGFVTLALFLALQTALLAFLAFVISRAVTQPWMRLMQAVRRIEGGDFRARIEEPRRGFEFRLLGREINRMLDTIAEKDRLLEETARYSGWFEVASLISHQLKNPLTSLRLAGRNIGRAVRADVDRNPVETAAGQAVENNLAVIEEESRRMEELLRRLKDLTRLPEMEKARQPLLAFFRGVAGQYAAEQAVIAVDGSEDVQAAIDARFFREAVDNLIRNSIEAAPTLPAKIRIRAFRDGARIVAEIDDAVEGLEPAILESLFRPRFTTKKAGMGLGLAIVRKIAVLHGGVANVRLNDKGGLLFRIELPGEADEPNPDRG